MHIISIANEASIKPKDIDSWANSIFGLTNVQALRRESKPIRLEESELKCSLFLGKYYYNEVDEEEIQPKIEIIEYSMSSNKIKSPISAAHEENGKEQLSYSNNEKMNLCMNFDSISIKFLNFHFSSNISKIKQV